jgi:hypothetical protein
MGCKSKSYSLLIILILAASSIALVKPANAQTIPLPPVPTFTLKFVPAFYNTTDPYTGASLQINNNTIQVSIRNQPFTAPSSYSLYYHVQTKGHFENDSWNNNWDNFIEKPSSFMDSANGYGVTMGFKPSKSDYTVLTFIAANYPTNAQIDFQVKAVVYNLTDVFYSDHPLGGPELSKYGHYTTQQRLFETGDWSNTQTITIPASASPTPTPTIPEFSSLAIQLTLITMVAVAGLLVYFKKRKN